MQDDRVKKFWWIVTDAQEVDFTEGAKCESPDAYWYFPRYGVSIHQDELHENEKAAVKAAKERVKKFITFYKEKLARLNKR